jgi:hypothetical protein
MRVLLQKLPLAPCMFQEGSTALYVQYVQYVQHIQYVHIVRWSMYTAHGTYSTYICITKALKYTPTIDQPCLLFTTNVTSEKTRRY